MPDYLIFKLPPADALDTSPQLVQHIYSELPPEEAIKQGYEGDGRYAIVDWDERLEADLAPGDVAVSAKQDRAAREKARAKAEAQEAKVAEKAEAAAAKQEAESAQAE